MASTSTDVTATRKRSAESILVDPDTLQTLEDAKKPKIDLDSNRKYSCISAIVSAYEMILQEIFPPRGEDQLTSRMEVDTAGEENLYENAKNNITVGNHIISIIFTIHNISRQEKKNASTNMIEKAAKTSFKVHFCGKDYNLSNDKVKELWLKATRDNGLEYKNFEPDNKENWYGTMGPYLDMFSAFALRFNELRLGHNHMPIAKENGRHKSFPVTKYGLSGAHHILLEGTSFPPERRSSIVQSLGPMTAWLCMLRSDGIYRKKYAAAVKRAFSHVPCIDDLTEITKNVKQASEVSAVTTLLAEILLVTTSRQATRMFFPITMFSAVWRLHLTQRRDFCDFFSSTGAGGWYAYKIMSETNLSFSLGGMMEEEMASQIVFHSIFGTFKEDLGILSQMTDVGTWYTREQMGSCFRQQGSCKTTTKITLPKVKVYAKMSCANQSGMLSGVYTQISTMPCFSGKRVYVFDDDFFSHIEKRNMIGTSGKTLNQIVGVLTATLEELHDTVRKNNGKIEMGTTQWRDMRTLALGAPGDVLNITLMGTGRKFLGRD